MEEKLEKLEKKEFEIKELEEEEEKIPVETLDSETFKLFKAEFDTLHAIEKEYDAIYEQVKDHYDAIANARGVRGALTFISAQTSNLISIKSAKSGIIRDRINLKKSIMDYDFKKDLHSANNDTAAGMATELLKAIIKDERSQGPIEVVDAEFEEIEEELSRVAKELEEKGAIVYSEAERDLNQKVNVDAVISTIINADESYTEDDEEDAKKKKKSAVPEDTPEQLAMDAEIEALITEYEREDRLEKKKEEEFLAYYDEEDFVEEGLESEEIIEEVEEIEEVIEELEEKPYSLAIGLSHDRSQWDYVAVDNETGDFLEIDDLPSTDGLDLKLLKQGGELVAYLSNGEKLPVYTVEFEYEEEE